jgi:hypothetical protein
MVCLNKFNNIIQFRIIENPDLENPDLENPDLENPGLENPGLENPDLENPGPENLDFENSDFEIIEDELTPPPSPPSPPGPLPPSPPLWNQDDFNFYTNLLQLQITELENKIIGPHIVCIAGIQHLRPMSNKNWNDKICHLLFEAKIPFFWILECIPDNGDANEDEGFEDNQPNDATHPQRVHIYTINHHVKAKIRNNLNLYLTNEYKNIVYIEE